MVSVINIYSRGENKLLSKNKVFIQQNMTYDIFTTGLGPGYRQVRIPGLCPHKTHTIVKRAEICTSLVCMLIGHKKDKVCQKITK